MAYVPGCTYDLFFSYASENNRDGWVERFVDFLCQELVDLLGRQFSPSSVFFDKRQLEVGQSFPDELAVAARDSAILVPILSRGYLTSPWCNRERDDFFSRLPYGSEPSACIAPIMLRPINDNELDQYNRDAQRISFVGEDNLSPLQVGSEEWNSRARQFAGQLSHALQRLRRNCRPIFLGKVPPQGSQDLRSWCRVELERRYFRIVPESLASLDSPEAIRAQLQEANLAIHFLGGADTPALEAIYSSAQVCYGPTVLFQPFGAELAPHEEIWLSDFEQDLPASTDRYQRLAGKNNQELIRLIEEIMSAGTPATAAETGRGLALICERPDLLDALQLRDTITATGKTEVHFPEFLNAKFTPTQNYQKWQDLFKRGKQLLFYHGASERARLEAKWRQAGLDNPKAPREWYLAPPDLDAKRRQYPDAWWQVAQVVEHLGEDGSGR